MTYTETQGFVNVHFHELIKEINDFCKTNNKDIIAISHNRDKHEYTAIIAYTERKTN